MNKRLNMFNSKNKFNLYAFCLCLVICSKLPVFIMGYDSSNIVVKGDEYIHVLISSYPLSWQSFTGVFPFGAIFFIKVFNYNLANYKLFMFIFSCVSWSYPLFILNYYQYNLSKLEHRLINLALLLFISSIAITSWDNNIGSDSLTLSFLVIILSTLFLFFLNQKTLFNMTVFLLSSVYFVLLRDSNYLILICIYIFLLLCENISIKYKLISIFMVVLSVAVMITSSSELRSRIHFRDILAMYIVENDSLVQKNKEYYQWYMLNTSMPDIAKEYHLCNNSALSSDLSYKSYGIPDGLPKYPFDGEYSANFLPPVQANYVSSYLTGENCLPIKTPEFSNYFYSNNLSHDYLKFLIYHPDFMLFGSGKYLLAARFLIFSPAKISSSNSDKLILSRIMNHHKIIFYTLLHFFYLLLQLVIWKNILFSNKRIRRIWLFGLFTPALVFAWLCFIAEPLELARHLLAGEWYMIIGGLYLVLFNKFNDV